MHAKSLFDLTGKVAIVTGSSMGIGSYMAKGLSEAGAKIVICARRIERGMDVVKQIEEAQGELLCLKCDISSKSDVEHMVEETLKKWGRIDILVNNAAITWGAITEDMKIEDWEKVLKINLTGTFICTQTVGRAMIKQGGGKIINVSSIGGIAGVDYFDAIAYVTTKGGIIAFTKDLAVKWAKYGITVNAIAPGYVLTHMSEPIHNKVKDKVLNRIPLGRFGNEDDFKGVVLFLASRASDYITGHVLVVDGGYLAI